jgi:hypothetical protein
MKKRRRHRHSGAPSKERIGERFQPASAALRSPAVAARRSCRSAGSARAGSATAAGSTARAACARTPAARAGRSTTRAGGTTTGPGGTTARATGTARAARGARASRALLFFFVVATASGNRRRQHGQTRGPCRYPHQLHFRSSKLSPDRSGLGQAEARPTQS